MDRKQANLFFHHSEKFNAHLFLLSGALDSLEGMKGEKLEGGKEVLAGILDGLRRQLKMSQSYFPSDKASVIEKGLDDMEADIELQQYDNAREKLGKVISCVATVSNEHINVLLEEDLI
jgi:hypothetical protein